MPRYSENCDMIYRNFNVALKPNALLKELENSTLQLPGGISNIYSRELPFGPRAPKRALEDEEDLSRYRRVRVRLSESHSLPNDGYRLKVYELRNNDWCDLGTGYGQQVSPRTSWIL